MQTDWNDILFRDAFTQEYNISISGGTEKTTYYNSLGYSKENGNVPGVSMTRFNLTSKTSYQINKILKIGVSIFANRRKNKTLYLISMVIPILYSTLVRPIPIFIRMMQSTTTNMIMISSLEMNLT